MVGGEKNLTQMIDETVFTLLNGLDPDRPILQQQTLGITKEDVLAAIEGEPAELLGCLRMQTRKAYPDVEPDVIAEMVGEAAERIKAAFGRMDSPFTRAFDTDLQERLLTAFTNPDYIGDAGNEFAEYLKRSWDAYRHNRDAYVAPYAAIVQSSDFGKSRLLYELAQKTIKQNETIEPKATIEHEDCDMRVLYTCTRLGQSTGFPEATIKLRDWLFGSKQTDTTITNHLEAIYHYAQENWSTVGSEWIELFTDAEAGETVQEKLRAVETELQSKRNTSAKNASTGESAQVERNAQETSEEQKPSEVQSAKVVILAVDEARALLEMKHRGVDCFRLLRRALGHANRRILTSHPAGGIFAVLVDTNSKVSDLTPPSWSDPSYRDDTPGSSVPRSLFPPFVLTHTMDVHWRNHDTMLKKEDEISAYKSVVTESSTEVAWDALISMGRPMWASIFKASTETFGEEICDDNVTTSESTKRLLTLARRKLLLGCDPGIEASYSETTMFVVASMLCRLGLRPYSTSALASRVVADIMAILAYVKYENDGQLSTYASDPVLALGATHVWYALDSALPKYIMPQFKKLLLQEVLDTGGIGEVVARIVLLLAIDTCVVMKTKAEKHRKCQFTGQFVSVDSFVKALGGAKPRVMRSKSEPATPDAEKAFAVWRSKWCEWEMGFCHFVQLNLEPTGETLWFLLGRRAAGVFPRNQRGADLVIPMYCGSKVSMILIQVKNVENRDSRFPQSATKKLRPSFVFAAGNPLSEKPSLDVIRVYMNLRETVGGTNSDRFFLTDVNGAVEPIKPVPTSDSSAKGSSISTTLGAFKKRKKSGTSKKRKVSSVTPSGASNDGTEPLDSTVSASTAASQPSNDAFTLCLLSVRRPWDLVEGGVKHPVISEAVSTQLADLALSVWNPMGLIHSDLRDRRAMEAKHFKSDDDKWRLSSVMPDDKLEKAASRVLKHAPGYSRSGAKGDGDCMEIEEEPAVLMSAADTATSSDQQSR